MNPMMNRRTLLRGLGALSLAGTAGGLHADSSSSDNTSSINLSDDVESLRAYVKLAGTTEDGMVHYWYTGTIFGKTAKKVLPMVGWTGLLKMVWRNLGNGSFHFRLYDLAYFTDPGSNKRIDSFVNPFTGETNYPIDIIGGPFDVVLSPKQLPWITSGDDIWVTEPNIFSYINKLKPDEWPLASSGEMLNMIYLDGFQGKLSDLKNDRIKSAPATLNIAHVNPWYPFFMMGQQDGVNLWHGHGKKVMDLSDITPEVLAYVEHESPGFIESESPWSTRTDSYKEYKEQRDPVKP
tara:strand:+ start:626 stop:1504 length:879 start_codon:yes stop_codon:yes gene_type:complete